MILNKMGTSASTVAYLSMNKFKNNDTEDVGMFVPRYIRRSDAELNLTVS
ncbi:MAG: hypothetical protein JRC55_03995 [Deltaproteobacteria bacterium]|nr:hypothetical protein [Deltaproteobacteria bacterium]